MKKKLLTLSLLFLVGCTNSNYYTISSPDNTKCLTFEYITSFNPNKNAFIKLYYGKENVNKNEYLKIKWSKDFGIMVNWNSKPIKVRSFLLEKSTIPDRLLNFKDDLTEDEYKEFKNNPSRWTTYQLGLIPQGKYKSCQ